MIEINGSHGEGGGQILRTALALSALTGKPFKIHNIRAKRKNPGLRPQHLNAVKAVAELCDAEVSNIEVGTKEFTFKPGEIKSKTLNIDIGTAGATTLILHALLPAVIHSGKQVKIRIKGGTNNPMAPPIDNVLLVFIPTLNKFGAKVEGKLIRRGYYPKGNGEVFFVSKPSSMEQIELVNRGNLKKIVGIANASKQLEKAKVSDREAKGAVRKLKGLNIPIDIKKEYCETHSVGTSISLAAIFENGIMGSDAFGKLGKPAEKVGEDAAKKLLNEINSNGCTDEFLTDQLIPYLGLLGGQIKASKISEHTRTNIWVVEKFLPVKFSINEKVISCKEKKMH
jgi:RNA 3'-terminal phosphate cyclase (GTP)